MIRFVLRHKRLLSCGAVTEDLCHIDDSVFELERTLMSGGFSEDQYDFHELIGVEIIPDPSIEVK